MNNKNKIADLASLPKGWVYCPLENVIITQKGKRPSKLSPEEFEGSVPYLDIKAIETGKNDYFADEISSVVTNESELVIVWDGSRSGWVGKSRNGALGSTLVSVKPILIDYNYLYYFLKSKFEYLNSKTKGAGIPHVNQDLFWQIAFPLAPLEEQKVIGKKLEEAFNKLLGSQASVEKVPAIVQASKQKILTNAISGELTKEWRERNIVETTEPELSEYVPDAIGWYNVKAEDCCIKISNGATPKGRRFEIETGIPFLKVYNIVGQKVDFEYKPQFIDKSVHAKQSKSIVYPNDVLINIVGPPLGKVALVPNDYPEWNINQALVLFRPKTYLLSEYLYMFLAEGSQIKSIEDQYKGSAGQSNISLTQCRNFVIRIPPIQEQCEIVKIVREQFADLDRIFGKSILIKKSISASIEKILEEAFTGELTSQESEDTTSVITFPELKKEKERLLKALKNEREARAKKKNILMATKKSMSLKDILKKEFGKREFTFDNIVSVVDMDYEAVKDEIYILLENDLELRFDPKSEVLHFKFITI